MTRKDALTRRDFGRLCVASATAGPLGLCTVATANTLTLSPATVPFLVSRGFTRWLVRSVTRQLAARLIARLVMHALKQAIESDPDALALAKQALTWFQREICADVHERHAAAYRVERKHFENEPFGDGLFLTVYQQSCIDCERPIRIRRDLNEVELHAIDDERERFGLLVPCSERTLLRKPEVKAAGWNTVCEHYRELAMHLVELGEKGVDISLEYTRRYHNERGEHFGGYAYHWKEAGEDNRIVVVGPEKEH